MKEFWREEGELRRKRVGVLAIVLALLAASAGFIGYRLWRQRRPGARDGPARVVGPPPQGLTEWEAAARLERDGMVDNVIGVGPALTRKQIVRSTIFTIFNLNLILLALIQMFFVRPLDGLITLGIIIANVAANVLQYELAQRRLKAIQEEARPEVTVMREGRARSIDPREIVVGDVIAAGQGDQIIADGVIVGDGQLFLDETMLGSGRRGAQKHGGDPVLAGSICLQGRAAYRADVLGDRRQVIQTLRSLPQEGMELTAIEKILNRVMRFVLLIMIVLAGLTLLRAFRLDLLGTTDSFVDPIIVILNLAPASLFFMVLLTYVAATADLVKFGALVQQSRSVESLAQLDVLCFGKAGFLTGIGAELQPVAETEGDQQTLAVSRIRQILGDFAHSSRENNPLLRALAAEFPGTQRKVKESAPFLSAYGWTALIFDDEDLQGVYVLAEPEVLALDLAKREAGEGGADEEQERSLTRSLTGWVRNPLARFRSRGDDGGEERQEEAANEEPSRRPDGQEQDEPKKSFFGRITSGVRGTVGSVSAIFSRDEAEPQEQKPDEPDEEGTTLIFAYNEQIRALDLAGEEWQLSAELQPLGQIRFAEKVKPEARDAVNLFGQRGVAVKIFTGDEPQKTAARLRAAGVRLPADPELTAVDGPQLAELEAAELAQLALSCSVFGSLSAQQAAAIVHTLRAAGHSVGVAGDGVSDVAALREAELAIVRKDSSPAVLGLGDLVLLAEPSTTLSRVLDKGQRIVNGLVDILKLYLTQIFYLLFLIVAIPLLLQGFPYTSQQAGLVGLITLTIPAFALTLWARSGKLPRAKLARLLLNFFLPAALAIAVLGFLVYAILLRQGSSVAYAQNVLTYAVVLMGLLLVLQIKPPIHFYRHRPPAPGDIRPLIMVFIALVVFVIIGRIPFFSEMFGLMDLQNQQDLQLVIAAGLIWVIVVNLFWWLFPVVTTAGEDLVEEAEELVDEVEETVEQVSTGLS